MMLGVLSDRWPTREEVAALDELSSGLPWASCSHHARWISGGRPTRHGDVFVKVDYTVTALGYQYTINPVRERLYGWKKPLLHLIYWRFGTYNTAPLSWIREEPEANITGNQRGIAHLGADFWAVGKNRRGRRVATVTDRYPESYWHSLNIFSWMLAPGPDGPVGTARFEALREGIQECEARIAIESALTDAALRQKLGPELARRAQQVLDERQIAIWKARGGTDEDIESRGVMTQYREIWGLMYGRGAKWNMAAGHNWFLASSWHERTEKLLSLAGEVTKRVQFPAADL
jgi:hypothetical protein